jgi:dTDP-4-amino-4,6-dideoxygalactose transaminase
MKVPFVDLHSQYLSIKSDIDNAIYNVINETAFIGGKYVNKFEEEFSNLYGVKHCISVANGTDSLFIIMKMLGIGVGDEVITVCNSWISTSETISLTGARPIFVDIDPIYYTINEDEIEKNITAKTKAIIPVHIYGQVCDMDKLVKLSQKYNIPIIEDCAQSHFSEFNNKRVGTFGIASSFSFYPGKNLGAYGDAGCILTNSDEMSEKCKMFARHGALKKHNHIIEGINSRMDGIQASILTTKLPHIIKWTQLRREKASLYRKYLSNSIQVALPVERDNSLHSYHLFVIRVQNRENLIQHLNRMEIEVAIHYPKILPNLEAYKYLNYNSTDFPIANTYQNEILSLPIYPEITEPQIKYVCEQINNFYKI